MEDFKSFSRMMLMVLVALTLSGCAGMMSNIPSQEALGGIVGMSKEAVAQKLGPPTDRSRDGNIWYYKKPTNNFINNVMLWCSFGFVSGKDSLYVDAARVAFRNGKAYSTQIMNGNTNLNFSSLGLASDVADDMGLTTQKAPEPSIMGTAIGIVGSAASSMGLGSMVPAGFTPEATSRNVQDETVEPDETDEVGKKAIQKASTRSAVTVRQVNLLTECSMNDAKNRICANAKKLGYVAVKRKDGNVNITGAGGINVKTSFEPVGKDVVVELSSSGQLPGGLSHDLCRIVERCRM